MTTKNGNILNCYDCIFMGDKSQNIYQIRLNQDSTNYFRDIIADLFLKIDGQTTKPAYVDSLLNHHFNYCKESKKDFIFDLEEQIQFVSKFVFSNERLFQSSLRTKLFEDWIERKKLVSENYSFETSGNQEAEKQPYGAKYFALLHKIKIELGIENDFKKNKDNNYIRKLIEKYAIDNYLFNDGQPFYRAFLDKTNTSDKLSIAKTYGTGYKEILIKLSNNDHRIIEELKSYPN